MAESSHAGASLSLRVEPPVGDPYAHPLEEASLVLGRGGDADLQLLDRSVSRHHCRLYRAGDTWMLEDLGSRNGTRLNGRAIEAAGVAEGDLIEVCSTRIRVVDASAAGDPERWEAAGAASPAASGDGTRLLSDPASYMPRDPGDAADTDASSLRLYADRLKVMNEVHEELSASGSLAETLAAVLDLVYDHLLPRQAAILLRRDDGTYTTAAQRAAEADVEVFFSTSLVREVGEGAKAALVLDTAEDERFAGAESILHFGVRSILAAPLLQDGETLGIIALSSDRGGRPYSEADLALLVSVAAVAAMRIRNVALMAEAAERRRLEEELTLARRLQKRLLPEVLPEIPGYTLLADNRASRWVSGDFYTVAERSAAGDAGEAVFLLADVSGKGMAASLLAASLEALVAGPIEVGQPPEEICGRSSRRLHKRSPPEKFATAFVAVLDPGSGRVTYANAGHNPGLLVAAGGEVETLGSTGPPLGLFEDMGYTARETHLGAGDTLVLYTDGITEAADPDGEEYGLERLSDLCVRHRELQPEGLAREVAADLERFTGGAAFSDDRTLLLVRRLGPR